VSQDLARFHGDAGFELRSSAYARLRAREVQRVGLEAAARLRTNFHPVAAGEQVQGQVVATIQASGGKVVIMSDVTGCLRYLGRAGSRTSVDERFSGSCGLVGWSAAECAGYSDNVCWLNQEEFVFDKTCFPRAARIQG